MPKDQHSYTNLREFRMQLLTLLLSSYCNDLGET
jgi:hypothetical protein